MKNPKKAIMDINMGEFVPWRVGQLAKEKPARVAEGFVLCPPPLAVDKRETKGGGLGRGREGWGGVLVLSLSQPCWRLLVLTLCPVVVDQPYPPPSALR